MSKLENDAKPSLRLMITGQAVGLDVLTQAKLAAWVVKTCMMNEYFPGTDVVSTQAEREYLMRAQLPPAGWAVLIAPYSGSGYQLSHNHYRVGIDPGLSEVPPRSTDRIVYDMQSSTFGLGRLVVHGVSLQREGFAGSFPERNAGKIRIWPVQDGPILWPTFPALDDLGVERLRAALYQTLVSAGMDMPPPPPWTA